MLPRRDTELSAQIGLVYAVDGFVHSTEIVVGKQVQNELIFISLVIDWFADCPHNINDRRVDA